MATTTSAGPATAGPAATGQASTTAAPVAAADASGARVGAYGADHSWQPEGEAGVDAPSRSKSAESKPKAKAAQPGRDGARKEEKDGGLLSGLSVAEKAEVAKTLRSMRVLESDRPVAETMAQEAEAMSSTLPQLASHDPGLSAEVWQAVSATLGARAALQAETATDSTARQLPASKAAAGAFLARMRDAQAGDASALTAVESARKELLEAETAEVSAGAAGNARDPSKLSVVELAAWLAREHADKVQQDPGATAGQREQAIGARKFAEFHAMRVDPALRDRLQEEEPTARRERTEVGKPENEVEADGLLGSNKIYPPNALPDHFVDRYEKHGKDLHRVGDPKHVVLVDHGKKLTTAKEFDSEAINAMVDVAEARGWSSLSVKGTPQFKQAMWTAARARGLDVRGYKPTDAEQARMDKVLEKNGKQNSLSENEAVKAFKSATSKEDRARAMGQHPELKAAFKFEAAGAAFARERLQGKSRDVFLDRMRHNIAFDLAQGREIATVALIYPGSKARAGKPAETTQPHRDAGRER